MINLRKKEVLDAMQEMLLSNDALSQLIQRYIENKEEITRSAHMIDDDVSGLLKELFNVKSAEQQDLIEHLLKEEKLQKEAFESLQLKKDSKHTRIKAQINMIYQELAGLTAIEREQRRQHQQNQMITLEQKRQALTDLLIQLMNEKESREKQLRQRMLEMEEQREANQTDYWLVQYQRLMDRKPQSLMDMEMRLESAVSNILKSAKAADYISVFARHRITIETMCNLTDEDLKQMGMHELGLRKAVLREIEAYKMGEEEKAAVKQKKLEDWDEEDRFMKSPKGEMPIPVEPSAPDKSPVIPSSPPLEVIARGINSECVICMDKQSSVLFLTCGHVCSCQECAEPLDDCPMCRGKITQRILLI
ncbi:hypothetical protein LSH36_387g02057 [Paralvinella palmiformis]|uniref:RING-type domain-containing protein n=1 Tax=Paralvinella palmiformis TaxID=53620 RepID=A0AAD9JCV5_9ANNE|nr:hypothetical protein LSH36_387g02057 [Paralvinella palmiformis]